MNQLILFDIDGTILYPGTMARELMNDVVADFTGMSPDLHIDDVAGFTDPVIIREALQKVHFDGSNLNSAVNDILDIYLVRLKRKYPFYEKPKLYDDAIDLVYRCKQEGWHVALLSGNLREGAKIKLERFNIWSEFDFGVFGDDAGSREDLLLKASEVAKEELGEVYSCDRIVIVGDTANDARVARLHGTRSLIVCRYPDWKSKIEAQNPTWVVDSFNDIEPIMHWLKGE